MVINLGTELNEFNKRAESQQTLNQYSNYKRQLQSVCLLRQIISTDPSFPYQKQFNRTNRHSEGHSHQYYIFTDSYRERQPTLKG